jgi:hypothetical protein
MSMQKHKKNEKIRLHDSSKNENSKIKDLNERKFKQ